VGSDCLLMAYTHVAHDCELGNHVILSNAVNMAGHVAIEDWVIVGGLTPIHQFVRIGAHAFVGGAARLTQDVPPYVRVAGSPARLYGLNSVGLDRRGFSDEVRKALKVTYRILFQSNLNVSQALLRAESEVAGLEVPDLAATMPSWSPGSGDSIAWLAFSSTRPYGAIMPTAARGQIWISGLDLTRDGDPSFAAFWLPPRRCGAGGSREASTAPPGHSPAALAAIRR
jgi:hypothetical protein